MRDYEPYYTEDGSIGLYSYTDKDVYHSKFGALTEAWEKFVLPSNIDKILSNKEKISVLDICYGIGYNTKALMSFVLDKKYIEIKNINFLKKCFYKIACFVSIHTNKNSKLSSILSSYIDKIDVNKKHNNICIDCLDINEELIKLSPLFKTIKTPGEIFTDIVPNFLSCFKTYYVIKNLFEEFLSIFYPKNKKNIKELLDLKFKNMHIDREYKINNIVNYILINSLCSNFNNDYYSDSYKKNISNKNNLKFFDMSLIKYAKFNHFIGYKTSSESILSPFLHNIYYSCISKRNKNINFKLAEELFDINFYVNDARKSIKSINKLYDLIFLDAFAYTKAPQLWTVEFIAELYNRLSEHGVILTYSNSAQIRNTLLENKFYIGKILNKKTGKFVGTIASKDKSKIDYPLNNYELGLCNTKAGIPYHDPNLSFSNKEIMELREYEFMHSNLISSSKYMKIRSMRNKYE